MGGDDAAPSVEAVFRRERSRLVALLTRRFGLARLADAEDAVQGAMLAALRRWPLEGMPGNPAGWLHRVAFRLLVDHLRHVAPLAAADDAALVQMAATAAGADSSASVHRIPDGARYGGELDDDELGLLFALCHPALPLASQVALALHALGGVSLRELAAGMFTTDAALAQRLARARQTLAGLGVEPVVPAGEELAARRDAVLAALHLLFNEGYQSAGGAHFQREELCAEALRLARGLAEHPVAGSGSADALVALMLLQSARLASRLPPGGRPLLLHEQDRSRWDRAQISLGLRYLDRSRRAGLLSTYHLQAGIAAEHATAPSAAATRWEAIVTYYERLLSLDPSPAARLGHAVAVAELRGPESGLALLARVEDWPGGGYPFVDAARAEWLARLGRFDEAMAACDRALAAARSAEERALLGARRDSLAMAAAARVPPDVPR